MYGLLRFVRDVSGKVVVTGAELSPLAEVPGCPSRGLGSTAVAATAAARKSLAALLGSRSTPMVMDLPLSLGIAGGAWVVGVDVTRFWAAIPAVPIS